MIESYAEREERILSHLRRDEYTAKQLCDLTGLKQTYVGDILRRLEGKKVRRIRRRTGMNLGRPWIWGLANGYSE